MNFHLLYGKRPPAYPRKAVCQINIGARGHKAPARQAPSTLLVGANEIDGILYGKDLFGGIVGDFHREFFLKGHYELDGIETVCTQIIDEAGIVGHLVGFDAEMFNDDLLNAVGDVAHEIPLSKCTLALLLDFRR